MKPGSKSAEDRDAKGPLARRRSRRVILAVAGVLLTGLIGWLLLSGREPAWEGRSLSSWLEDFDTLPWTETNAPAVQAVRAMGTNAIPFLVADLLERDPKWTRRLRWRLRNWRVPWVERAPAEQARNRAFRALRALGPDAAPALPLLIDEIKKGQGQNGLPWIGVSAIVDSVDETIPTITNELSAPIYRFQGTFFLTRYVTNSEATVPYLMQCLEDDNPSVRRQALVGIGRFGADAVQAEDRVRGLTNDPDPRIRELAAKTLEAITAQPE